MMDVGRVCIKIAGRESGKICVIVKKLEDNFVLVTGPKSITKVKRRRCNIDHLEPTEHEIKVKVDAPDTEIEKEMKTIIAKIDPNEELMKQSSGKYTKKPKIEKKDNTDKPADKKKAKKKEDKKK